MQTKIASRSNRDRTEETKAKLIAAARELFIANGYAETSTPDIVKQAAVTRGALYHHYKDKSDLFRAVLEDEARLVGQSIAEETRVPQSALENFTIGAEAYFDAMKIDGRAKLLLIEGPSVLGKVEMDRINNLAGADEIRKGLQYAANHGALAGVPIAPLADMLSAAFDRAALAIAEGADEEPYKKAVHGIFEGLLGAD
ncbi:MAG: TetR/AcrR family transcriptional regulator [Thalassospira sp.]|uniref:TetR/AcrR family transcriptional regulator n=1 Tax=Thalassospira sp. TaxID=1912094 RepID=UPI003A83C9FB